MDRPFNANRFSGCRAGSGVGGGSLGVGHRDVLFDARSRGVDAPSQKAGPFDRMNRRGGGDEWNDGAH
jgi:hypothetical protein